MSTDITPRLGFWVLLAKLGAKFVPMIGKALGLLVKTKGGLAALSFAGYSIMFTWQFAIVIMMALGIHEAGHVWAMRRCGIPTRGFYFIPFLGGAAVPDRTWHTQKEHLYVALMGPVWGTLVALPLVIAYLLTKDALWAGIAAWVAVINLVNLLPIYPLDGGRVLHAVLLPSKSGAQYLSFVALTVLISVAMFAIGIYLFAFMGLIGVMELMLEQRRMQRRSELADCLAKGRELLSKLESRVESDSPGAFARCEQLQLEEQTEPALIMVQQLCRFEETSPSCFIGLLDMLQKVCSEEAYEQDLVVALSKSGLHGPQLGGLEPPCDPNGLKWAARVRGFRTALEKLRPEPVLEGLTNPQRILGLLSFFMLALTLAALVVILGSVDGANAALQTLQ